MPNTRTKVHVFGMITGQAKTHVRFLSQRLFAAIVPNAHNAASLEQALTHIHCWYQLMSRRKHGQAFKTRT